jgi:4'-phosphopantetheinyl transferase EntD
VIAELFPDSVVTVEAGDAHWNGALLPEEEAQILRAVPKRRRDFTAGRLCAREALARLGLAPGPLLSDADRVPRWPPGVVGSISHTAGWCGVAVARAEQAAGIGLDVEGDAPLDSRLVERICTPGERKAFVRLAPPPAADWPKLVFSLKEAVYKAYFPLARHFLGFHDVELEIDPAASRFEARLLRADAPAAAGRRRFPGRYAASGGFVCAGVLLA